MPGKWDGKSRPVNNKYRENYDDIFKKKNNTGGWKQNSQQEQCTSWESRNQKEAKR